jgi:hypothetical protein
MTDTNLVQCQVAIALHPLLKPYLVDKLKIKNLNNVPLVEIVSTLILTKNKRQCHKNKTHNVFIKRHDLETVHYMFFSCLFCLKKPFYRLRVAYSPRFAVIY